METLDVGVKVAAARAASRASGTMVAAVVPLAMVAMLVMVRLVGMQGVVESVVAAATSVVLRAAAAQVGVVRMAALKGAGAWVGATQEGGTTAAAVLGVAAAVLVGSGVVETAAVALERVRAAG